MTQEEEQRRVAASVAAVGVFLRSARELDLDMDFVAREMVVNGFAAMGGQPVETYREHFARLFELTVLQARALHGPAAGRA